MLSSFIVTDWFAGTELEVDPQLCSAVGQVISDAFPASCVAVDDVDTAMQVAEYVAQILADQCM